MVNYFANVGESVALISVGPGADYVCGRVSARASEASIIESDCGDLVSG